MKKYVTVTNATGTAAINATTAIWNNFRLSSVTVHFSAAPTTSELLTITVNAKDGAAYDTVIYSVNPSLTSATDITYTPTNDLVFENWDEIVVAFPNTETRTYGLRIATQSL